MATIKNLDDLKNLDKMEAFKTMSEGMDAKKNKKPHVCGNLVQCVLGIVMLSVGGVVSGVQILFVHNFYKYIKPLPYLKDNWEYIYVKLCL